MATPIETNATDEPAPDRDAMLDRYYAGGELPCPVGCGDRAEVVRVSTTEDGEGVLWVECRGCAQRLRYLVPEATPAERQRVEDALGESGREPACPRHRRRIGLVRRGRELVCSACGVRYRRA